VSHDIPLFVGILADLFPTISPPEIDYGALTTALHHAAASFGLQVCV
jgi:dynein heavy chain